MRLRLAFLFTVLHKSLCSVNWRLTLYSTALRFAQLCLQVAVSLIHSAYVVKSTIMQILLAGPFIRDDT